MNELEALIERALAAHEDSRERWDLIGELRSRGDRETFEATRDLLVSDAPGARSLAADVFAEFGGPSDDDVERRPFWAEITALVTERVVAEHDPEALKSAIAAAGHLRDERAVPALLGRSGHGDQFVRWAIVMALAPRDADDRAVDAMVGFTTDTSPLVRDWATFAFGTSLTRDTPEIRAALLARLDDEDAETRREALRALGRRGVAEAIPALLDALGDQEHAVDLSTVEEATNLMAAKTGDERLREAVFAEVAAYQAQDLDLPDGLVAAVAAYRDA